MVTSAAHPEIAYWRQARAYRGAGRHYGAVARVGGHRVGGPDDWGIRLSTIMA